MAGSLNHIVNEEDGTFQMDLIENLGDAQEALNECFNIIYELSGGGIDNVNEICDRLRYPKIQHDMELNFIY